MLEKGLAIGGLIGTFIFLILGFFKCSDVLLLASITSGGIGAFGLHYME